MNFLEMLVEYGIAGIFIAYMIWQDSSNSKKADAQLVKFEGQLDKMREKQSSDEKALRNRYDQVIKQYDDERQDFQKQKNQLKLEVVTLVSDSTSRLEKFQKIITDLTDSIKSQNFMILDQNRVLEKSDTDLKEVSTKLESCLKLITDMISDQKIRDAANAAAKNQFSSIIQSKD